MEYRTKGQLTSPTWLLQNGLIWVGIVSTVWNLLKPGGWLFRAIDSFLHNQPTGFYYLAVGVLGLLAGKVWIDNIGPHAFYNLLTAAWAFAGTFFILSLLLPL